MNSLDGTEYMPDTVAMRIAAIPQTHDWRVCADWLGSERAVFIGSLSACLIFTKENQR